VSKRLIPALSPYLAPVLYFLTGGHYVINSSGRAGGNALGNNAQEQLEHAKTAAAAISDLVEIGYRVVIAHGNGPQVGMIKKLMDSGASPMPIAECTAMSQGYIGYHLQQTLQSELKDRGIDKSVTTILTQVLVDKKDTAFQNPSKPIGLHYDEQTAKKLMVETDRLYIEDAGRGRRWVVPSPKPIPLKRKKRSRIAKARN